jgi:hypothetical protein
MVGGKKIMRKWLSKNLCISSRRVGKAVSGIADWKCTSMICYTS